MLVVIKTSVRRGSVTEPQPCKLILLCSRMVSTADKEEMDTIALSWNRCKIKFKKNPAFEDGRTLCRVILLWRGSKTLLTPRFIVFAVLYIFIFHPWGQTASLGSLFLCWNFAHPSCGCTIKCISSRPFVFLRNLCLFPTRKRLIRESHPVNLELMFHLISDFAY